MGCSSSFQASENIPGQGHEVLTYASKHHMTKSDVDSIFQRFKYFDVRRNNLVDVDEFIVGLGLQPEIFLILVFRLFDQDMDGNLTFLEFMMAYYQFLTLDKDSLALFTFSIFDLSGDGELNREELMFMMAVLEGKHTSRGHRRLSVHVSDTGSDRNDKLAYEELDVDGDGDVSALEFLSLVNRRASMMFLAFETQLVLRNSCLSERRWSELSKRRVKSIQKNKKGQPTFQGLAEMMDWDEHQQRCSSEYAFLALKGLHGLPTKLKEKVEEVDHHVKLVKAELQKKKDRDIHARSADLNKQGKSKGQKMQHNVASNYEAMHGGEKAGATDYVGARHTHSHTMTAGTSVHVEAHSPGSPKSQAHSPAHEHGKGHHSHESQKESHGSRKLNHDDHEHSVRHKPTVKSESHHGHGHAHKVGHE